MVRFVGSDEYIPTNLVDFDVFSHGTIDEFFFEGQKEFIVPQGQFVTYEFTNIEHVWNYYISLYNEDTKEWDGPVNECFGNKVIGSTLELPCGTYTVHCNANGVDGYAGREASDCGVLTVVEPETPVIIAVSKYDPATLENVIINWKIDGVVNVGLRRDDNDVMDVRDGERGATQENWNEPGTHTLTVFVNHSETEFIWEEYAVLTFDVQAPNGLIEFNTDDVPEQIVAGQGPTAFSITCDNCNYMGYEFSIYDQDGIYVDAYWENNAENGVANISVSQDNLITGYYIEVRVWADGFGYESNECRKKIPIVPATFDSVIKLTQKGGENTPVQVLVNQDAGLVIDGVSYPNVRDVKLWAGAHDGYRYCRYDAGDNRILLDFWYENDCVGEDNTVFALILLDGSDEYVMTNSLEIQVGSLGKTGAFDFGVPGAELTVTRGELVYFGFTVSDNATEYWVDAFDGFGGGLNPRSEGTGTSVMLMTSDLPEGQYKIYGRAGGPGWQWTESTSYVTLNVTEPVGDEILLNISDNSVFTTERIFASVIAAGADEVGLAVDDKGSIDRYASGSVASFDINWNESGVHTLYPCARNSGGDWEFGEGVVITVLAPFGSLNIDTSNVPATITENSDTVMITIPWSEDYEYLGYELSWLDQYGIRGEYSLHYDNTNGDPAEFGIPESWYVAGYTIELGIWAGGYGYEHTHTWISIPVVPASLDNPEVELSLADGLTPTGILVNKDFSFIISVPDGKEIREVSLWTGRYYDRRGCYIEDTGYRYWYRYDNEDAGKKYDVFALVKFTDSDDYVMTNVVPIDSVGWLGKTGDFDFADIENYEPVTVTRGELASFTFTQSENATEYWVDAFDEYDNSRNPQWSCDGTTVMMSTIGLEAGTYTVYGRAGNGAGWVWTESQHGVTLIVTEPTTGDEIVSSGKTDLLTYEETFVSVYAPNAYRIGFVDDGRYEEMAVQGHNIWENNSAALYRSWDVSGAHTVEVYVMNTGSDEWTKASEVTFTVEAPYGKITIDTSNVPTQITEGSDCEITIPWKNNYCSLGYDVHVVDMPYGNWSCVSRIENTEGSAINISIPAEYLKVGCSIELGVWAGGVGYEKEDYYVAIPVVPDNTVQPEAKLSISEGLTNGQAYVNSEIRFVIDEYEEGRTIEEVKLWFDRWVNGYDYLQQEDSFRFSYHLDNEYSDTEHPVFAAVRFSDSSDFVMTNVINVSVGKLGATGAFDFKDTNEVYVSRGEFVEFEFTPSENATYYWIDAFDNEDCWYDMRSTSDGTIVTVPTAMLSVGQYKLYGRAGGEPGWQWTGSQSYVILNVTEATGNDIQMTINKNEVLTLENVKVAVFADGASQIKVEVNGSSMGWAGGNSLTADLNWGNPGQYELVAYAMFEGGWVEGDHITVTVSAEYGNVVLDTSEVPGSLTEDDENVSFKIPWAEGIDYLGYEVRCWVNGNESFISRCDNTEGSNAVIQIPDTYLVAGNAIELRVWTGALGCLPTDYNFLIPVVALGSSEVTFTLEEASPYLRNVPYGAQISAPGATYVQVFDGTSLYDLYTYFGEGDIPNEHNTVINFPNAGTYTLYVVAEINGERITSEPFTVTVTTNGTAPTTDVLVPEYIFGGTNAVIQIEVPGDNLWYHLSVRNHETLLSIVEYQYGETVSENSGYTVTDEGSYTTITINADMLTTLTTYDVEVLYDAGGGCAMTSVVKTFRVIEPDVTITTPKKSRSYGETFEFTITAPLATSVELYKGDTKLDSFTWVADVFAPEITFTAVAYFEGLEEPRTSSITVEVTPLGQTPEPTLEVAESVLAGDVLNISVTAEEGVWYSIRVMQGEEIVLSGSDSSTQPFSLTAGNPEAGDYTVLLSYGKLGYAGAEITRTVEIIPAYTVTWIDGDGNVLKSEQVATGTTPVYTGDTPTKTGDGKYTYTFNNTWAPEISEVTAAATYTACFSETPTEHTITFVSTFGETTMTIATITQGYGTVITPPAEEPMMEGLVFQGWDSEIPSTMPDHDVTITAVWEELIVFQPTLNMADYTGLFVYIHIPNGEDATQYTVETIPHNTVLTTIGPKNKVLSKLPKKTRLIGEREALFYRIDATHLASDEMTDTVDVILKKNGVVVKTETYTVEDIVAERIASGTLDEVAVRLHRALVQYGYYSQIQFQHNLDNLPAIDPEAPALTEIPEAYAPNGDPTDFSTYITALEAKVDCSEAVSINVYLTPASGYKRKDFEIYVYDKDGNEYTGFTDPITTKGKIYFKINGIASNKMDSDFRIVVKLKSNPAVSATWTRSVITAAYEIYQTANAAGKEETKNLVMALYQYFLAAKEQFGDQ